MKKREKITVYMDLVAAQYEVGNASGGTKIHPSIDDVKKEYTCWKSCGIAEMTLTFKSEVEPQNFDAPEKKTKLSTEELVKNHLLSEIRAKMYKTLPFLSKDEKVVMRQMIRINRSLMEI